VIPSSVDRGCANRTIQTSKRVYGWQEKFDEGGWFLLTTHILNGHRLGRVIELSSRSISISGTTKRKISDENARKMNINNAKRLRKNGLKPKWKRFTHGRTEYDEQ